jgi:hypothetical protein
MKSRLILVVTIIAVMVVSVAIAHQSCPSGKSSDGVVKCCAADKSKVCDKDHDHGGSKDSNSPKDPNCKS